MFDTREEATAPRDCAPAPPGDDLASMPVERLEHEIESRAARISVEMCRWLELIAEFDRREGWGSWGCLTCAHWVAWRCSVSPRSAREHVRVARRLGELPLIHAEFAAGRLSYSKVRALTRVADAESEADLVELAGHATAAQLDVMVGAFTRASAAQAEETYRYRYVTWLTEPDGSVSLHANLPAEDGATVIAAIEAAAERLREERQAWAEPDPKQHGGSAEPPGGTVSRAEALVAIAADSLAAERDADASSSKPADRNLVVVHVDAAELAADAGERCHVRGGGGLPAETARRLACDASVVTLLERDGEPISAGRRTRSIPAPMRRAVEARDGGCRFPGCHHTRYVDVHHIHHWAAGGETSLDNLVMLCRRHHRMLHEGGYELVRSGDGLTFRRPDGTVLDPAPPPAPPGPAPPVARAGPLLTGGGERMDLDLCVGAMFQITEDAHQGDPPFPA